MHVSNNVNQGSFNRKSIKNEYIKCKVVNLKEL